MPLYLNGDDYAIKRGGCPVLFLRPNKGQTGYILTVHEEVGEWINQCSGLVGHEKKERILKQKAPEVFLYFENEKEMWAFAERWG